MLQTFSTENIMGVADRDGFLVSSWGGFIVDYISQPVTVFQVSFQSLVCFIINLLTLKKQKIN